jgi:small GTP-binding protein
MTIGIDFGTKIEEVAGNMVKCCIWDTAGQECFRSISRSYYRNADGILIVYDITDRETFDDVENWIKEVKENAS